MADWSNTSHNVQIDESTLPPPESLPQSALSSPTPTTPPSSTTSSASNQDVTSSLPSQTENKSPSIDRRLVVIEEGCAEIQKRAIDVIENYLLSNNAQTKHYSRRRPRLFTAAEYVSVYNIVYDMCTHYRVNASAELYQQYKETVEKYLTAHSLPAIQSSCAVLQSESASFSFNEVKSRQQRQRPHEEFKSNEKIYQIISFLQEVKHQWFDCLLLTKWLHKFISYVEKYWTRQVNVPNLYDVSFSLFGDIVYEKYQEAMTKSLLELIEKERSKELIIWMDEEDDNDDITNEENMKKMVIDDINDAQEEKMEIEYTSNDGMVVVDSTLFSDLLGLYQDMGIATCSDDDNNSGCSASSNRFMDWCKRQRTNRTGTMRKRSSLSLSNMTLSSANASASSSRKSEETTAYEEDFEKPLFEMSRKYYRARKNEWIDTLVGVDNVAMSTMAVAKVDDDCNEMLFDDKEERKCIAITLDLDFLSWTYNAMAMEEKRLAYLPPQSCAKLLDLFVEEVLTEDIQEALVGRRVGQQTTPCLVDDLLCDWDIDGLHKIYRLACRMVNKDEDSMEETSDINNADGLQRLNERFHSFLMKSSLSIRHKERKYMNIFHNKCIGMVETSFGGDTMFLDTFLEYYVGFETCDEMSRLVMEYL